MKKNSTGVKFTPEEFRKLNQCLQCGKAKLDHVDGVCIECVEKNIPKCDMCDILLRTGEQTFTMYDNQEEHRDGEDMIPMKRDVIEFEYKKNYPVSYPIDNLCIDCIDWEERMTDKCWCCKRKFFNSKENFKENGNLCELCAVKF